MVIRRTRATLKWRRRPARGIPLCRRRIRVRKLCARRTRFRNYLRSLRSRLSSATETPDSNGDMQE
ncbi:hypothetical protein [Microbulbifer discodermiae]|uniref:hypothetical protein n=1 Tax=Microbulbifer sp. 2201CG32-9 TaxID=3232309 RepID=UPI00345BF894